MSVALVDINVLIASVDEGHVFYRTVHGWFRQLGSKPWATCPLVQAGFVRIISNPYFHEQPVTLGEALDILAGITQRPGHRFWPMDIGLAEAVHPFQERLFGHKQVADAYLLGLAIRNKGTLVTLDRGIAALAGEGFGRYVTVLQ